MESLIKLNNQTAGRDKTARLLQYLSRLLWYRLQQQHKSGVVGWQHLEYQLSTFRKLLRFGRCTDSLHSSLSLFNHPDPTVCFTITLSKLCNAIFLLADHMLWLGRADLCNVNTDKWSNMSNKYWLFSITLNLVRDVYEIQRILKECKGNIFNKSGVTGVYGIHLIVTRIIICLLQRQDVVVDTLKNCCDLFIPLTALGHTKLSAGTIGFLGIISSLAGIFAIIDPKAKLTPA